MKIDSVHAEFMSGNAVSSTTSSHSIVSRDASGDIHAAGVSIAGNSGTLFSYTDGDRTVYGGCDSNDPWFGTSSNHDLRLVTNNAQHILIDKTGNIGIGTNVNPTTKLNMKGGVFLVENQASTNDQILYGDGGGTGANNNSYTIDNAKFGTGVFVNDTGTTGSTITLVNKEGANNTTKHASIGFVTTDTTFNGKFGGQIGFWPENANASKMQFRIYTSGAQAGYNLPVQRMVVDGDGNVGIGTTSPGSLLTFYKDYTIPSAGGEPASDTTQGITFRSDLNSYSGGNTPPDWSNPTSPVDVAKIWFQPKSYAGISSSDGVHGLLSFGTGYSGTQSDTPDMVIDTEGNVGIGTTSPAKELHVYGSIQCHNTGITGDEKGLFLQSVGDWYNLSPGNDGYLHLLGGASGQGHMSGNYSSMKLGKLITYGNVGIGTDDPDAKLHIETSVTQNQQLIIKNTDTTYRAGIAIINKHGQYFNLEHMGHGSNACVIENFSTVNSGIQFYAKGDGEYRFYTTDGNDERMRILNNGNVGIGVSNPDTQLHVNGAIHLEGETVSDTAPNEGNRTNTYIKFGVAGTSNDWAYLRQIGGNNAMKMALDFHDDSGDCKFLIRGVHSSGQDPDVITNRFSVINDKVGIGTDDPHGRLHIGPSDSDHIYLASDNNSYGWKLDTLDYGSGDVPFRLIRRTGGNDSTVLTIKNQDGNVGIGETSPSYKLDVNGTTRVGNILYIGKNTDDETAKSIFFGGTSGDNDYNHAVIERRVYSTGTEKQELLLFCGNDGNTAAGPDRIRLKGADILFDTLSGTQNARTTVNTKMILKSSGRVGIGITNPDVPLHVTDTTSTSVGDTHRWVTINAVSGGGSYTNKFGGAISDSTGGNYTYSIKTVGAISSPRFIIGSDERIKKDIVDVEDDEALVKLRMLHPKKYRFIDESAQGAHQIYGFLANEVQEVLPDAVVEHTNEVPSIYQFANATSSNVITFSGDFDTSKLESNVLVVVGVDQVKHTLTVDEIINSTSVRVVEDLSAFSGSLDEHGNVVTETQTLSITPEKYDELEDKDGFKPISDESNVITEYTKTNTTYIGDQLFVYGEVVDDFKHLQESAISTLSTSALQEVDRQLQAEKIKTANLTARVEELESMVSLIKLNMTWPDA